MGKNTFLYSAAVRWNNLISSIKLITSSKWPLKERFSGMYEEFYEENLEHVGRATPPLYVLIWLVLWFFVFVLSILGFIVL